MSTDIVYRCSFSLKDCSAPETVATDLRDILRGYKLHPATYLVVEADYVRLSLEDHVSMGQVQVLDVLDSFLNERLLTGCEVESEAHGDRGSYFVGRRRVTAMADAKATALIGVIEQVSPAKLKELELALLRAKI